MNLHKESTYATILDPDGEIVTQRRMPNEEITTSLRPLGVEKVSTEAPSAPLSRKGNEKQPLYRWGAFGPHVEIRPPDGMSPDIAPPRSDPN